MAATDKTDAALDALAYQAGDDTAREHARAAASVELAPDWYGRAPAVADAVSAVWEPIVRSLVTALESAAGVSDEALEVLTQARAALGDPAS